jgi:hypothetical protein
VAVNKELLGIYLNDHLAGAVGGTELARRTLQNNRNTPLAADLQRVLDEIEEDRQTLEDLMERLGVARSTLKSSAAWALEKVARLKLNGRIVSYSPLSRLLELEGLAAGVEAKRMLWASLKRLRDEGVHVGVDVEELIGRAQRQKRLLERRRLEAAAAALAGPSGS